MRALAIDTSTSTISVAIAGDGKPAVFAESRPEGSSQPSRNLLSIINGLLVEAGVNLGMIDLFAVSAGPGSFTGLRVGVGAALGLAAAMNKPVVGVETLTSIAISEKGAAYPLICPILNARRGEVYAAFFRKNGETLERLGEDMVIAPDRLAEMINEPVKFMGDGFGVNESVFRDRLKVPFTAVDRPERNTAEIIAEMAIAGRAVISPIELRYIRPSQAELNWEKLHVI